MIWASWADFFAMGGRGLYVWGSVLTCFIFMLVEWLQVRARTKAIANAIANTIARTAARANSATTSSATAGSATAGSAVTKGGS